jgi:putative chitinase
VTPAELLKAIPNAGPRSDIFAEPLTAAMAEFEITTPQRKAAFLGQVAHESGSLRYVRELADGSAYEGRADLGNTEPGDGPRYRGRGLLQITGRSNYAACGIALGLPLIGQPELLETPIAASRSAGWFWKMKNLNQYADRNMYATITKLVNGGYNGLDDRLARWLEARKGLGIV